MRENIAEKKITEGYKSFLSWGVHGLLRSPVDALGKERVWWYDGQIKTKIGTVETIEAIEKLKL